MLFKYILNISSGLKPGPVYHVIIKYPDYAPSGYLRVATASSLTLSSLDSKPTYHSRCFQYLLFVIIFDDKQNKCSVLCFGAVIYFYSFILVRST